MKTKDIKLNINKENAIYILQMEINKLKDMTGTNSIKLAIEDILLKLDEVLYDENLKKVFKEKESDLLHEDILKAKENAIDFLSSLIYEIDDKNYNDIKGISDETAINIVENALNIKDKKEN
ncbi:hypothetical protein [Clostridium sp. Ade.TY]|uniref:hypothetical protein n=1 Tax=Clostridium sp. Ade.TY TaxID=1391647 RepID=UPI00041453E5|nr:hypothetical protein [Clostridium sp. Ade.TY]